MFPSLLFGRNFSSRPGAKAAAVAFNSLPASHASPTANEARASVASSSARSTLCHVVRGLMLVGALAAGVLGLTDSAQAQLKVTPLGPSVSPTTLAQSITGGSSSGVIVSNVQLGRQ